MNNPEDAAHIDESAAFHRRPPRDGKEPSLILGLGLAGRLGDVEGDRQGRSSELVAYFGTAGRFDKSRCVGNDTDGELVNLEGSEVHARVSAADPRNC